MTGVIVSTNPFQPTEVVGEFDACGIDEVPAKLDAAEAGAKEWAALPATRKSHALHAAASALDDTRDHIAELVVREVGKPVTEARGEVQRGIDILRYHAGALLMSEGDVLPASSATGIQFTHRRPLGNVAVVTPWNFPVAIPLWKAVPALAWGNAVLLKPASAAVGVADALVETIGNHLPGGLLQNLPGGGALVRELVDSNRIHGLSFTGSTAVGMRLIQQASSRALPCQAEMGGSNPTVVLADADLEKAAAAVAGASMGFAGQKCTATSRIIIEDAIYEDFRDRLVAIVESLEVGDPTTADTVVGPVINQHALDSALEAIDKSNGRTLTGGAATGDGYTLRPTLVEVDDADILLENEVFAPVAALVRANNAEDAFRRASDTPFGLSAGLYTQHLGNTLAFLEAADAGMIRVNAPTTGVDFWAPFGGMKSSSYGTREQGQSARDFYTHGVTVFIDR